MPDSQSRADVHVRATVEKFDGNPPTRVSNALRKAVLLGPKLPVEIITVDDKEGVSVRRPSQTSKIWLTARVIAWLVNWWMNRRSK